MSSRRNFIQLTSIGLATAVMQVPLAGSAASAAQKKPNLSLGIAGYTFSKIELASAITMMKRLDVSNLSLKDVYLPLSSSLLKFIYQLLHSICK
jgi:inosose dehydratase